MPLHLAPPQVLRALQCVRRKEFSMLDFLMLALGLGFFALSLGYVMACDWL
jgi:hypothetical protein